MGAQTKATARVTKKGTTLVVEAIRTPDINELIAGEIDMDKIMKSVQAKAQARAQAMEKSGDTSLQQQLRFIQLRAEGMSFAKIAQELNISKPTLLKWHVEMTKEIQQARFYAIEAVVEEYKLRKQHRIQELAALLTKAQAELQKRDFSELSTSDLLKVVERLEEKLLKEIQSVSCETGETKEILLEDHFKQEVRMHIEGF